MTVKLVLLKSGEDIIADVTEMIVGEGEDKKVIGYFFDNNPVNYWFLITINDIYKAPILKWIFGFAGIIFMLNMIQRGITYTQLLIMKISGKEPEKKENPLDNIMKEFEKMNNPKTNQSSEKVDLEDDLYVDFEEMDEDEDTK